MTETNKSSGGVTLMVSLFIAAIVGAVPIARARGLPGQQDNGAKLATSSEVETGYPNDPARILRRARVIHVHSCTDFIKPELIEVKLQERADFRRAGLLLTKDPKAADLTLEVRRANFTTSFQFVVIDSKTKLVVASGKVNSMFGTASGKIAKVFVKQVQAARTAAE